MRVAQVGRLTNAEVVELAQAAGNLLQDPDASSVYLPLQRVIVLCGEWAQLRHDTERLKTELHVEKCLRVNQANEHSQMITELKGEIFILKNDLHEAKKMKALDWWRKIFPWRLVRWDEWENR